MPTFQGNPLSSFYKRIMQVSQSSNTGFDNSSRAIETGDGVASAVKIGKAGLNIQPTSSALDSTGNFNVQTSGGDQILQANTTDSTVKAGASLANVLTMHKEMGLYEFSPNSAGYHYPLIANRVGMQGAEGLTYDDDWGNGTDPATSLDVSGLTDPENAIAVYWYIQHNITLDAVRYLVRADGSATVPMHLMAYSIDSTTNFGDLSAGAVCASGSASATSTGIKTGTLSLDSANIDSGKVVVGFIESSTTDDMSIALDIYYHIR
tara:strand:+ start:705 stop:1496 length:792 start_codon:yes stop_codon:yes gene_type:complete